MPIQLPVGYLGYGQHFKCFFSNLFQVFGAAPKELWLFCDYHFEETSNLVVPVVSPLSNGHMFQILYTLAEAHSQT